MIEIEPIHDYLLSLQGNISDALLSLDGTLVVQEDKWQREGGGSGCSRVLSQGQIFEKAGVNFSHISGQELPASATTQRPELSGRRFQAMGVSSVVHPLNPHCLFHELFHFP